jgi:hypothetical protein
VASLPDRWKLKLKSGSFIEGLYHAINQKRIRLLIPLF